MIPYNAGDPDQNEINKRFAAFRANLQKKALAATLASEEGCQTLARILAMTGIYRSTLDSAGNEGMRATGLAIKQMIETEVDPDAYHKLIMWANAEERKIAEAFADASKPKTETKTP